MSASSRPTALALLISLAVTGSLCVWAVVSASESIRTTVAWGAGSAAVLLSAAVATAVHARATSNRLRARLSAETQRFTGEISRLVSTSAADGQRFTAETGRIKATAEAETARIRATAEAETARITAQAAADTEQLTAEAKRLRARVARSETERSAAVAASANAAGRMQALATSMLADLRQMEDRHSSDDVLADLLHLDHRTAQAGRLADSIAVLTGARSGRRWAKPIVMESILRGAMGRISGYQRVRLHSTSDIAVAGHAAEGVMHALAELLDNAANFSPPTAEVHVYVEEVPAGIVLTVEDSGLVMSDVQLRRAERAVSATDQGLTGISGTRLGLAVVGRLARKHGLTVSFRPSARGGTGALLMLPQELLTRVAAPEPSTGTASEPEPAHEAVAAADTTDARHPRDTAVPDDRHAPEAAPDSPASSASSDSPMSETTGHLPRFGESGLPKRPRGRTLAAAEARAQTGGTPATPRPRNADPKEQAARFSSFRRAVRANSPHPEEGNTP
ncbi:ATP-binding protein [Streptomyces sp. NPDC052052]|uniref:sensor histidine kinase n=1 Tax=Streptomyces sp. NPDC052052 TaxID=3154756 RepID=UPI0034495690